MGLSIRVRVMGLSVIVRLRAKASARVGVFCMGVLVNRVYPYPMDACGYCIK